MLPSVLIEIYGSTPIETILINWIKYHVYSKGSKKILIGARALMNANLQFYQEQMSKYILLNTKILFNHFTIRTQDLTTNIYFSYTRVHYL